MNLKLFLMHSALLCFASCTAQISRSLYRQHMGVLVNKPLTSSNLISQVVKKVSHYNRIASGMDEKLESLISVCLQSTNQMLQPILC